MGELVYDYYHEDDSYLGSQYVYNGAESALWVNFRESFPDEIQALYAEWRSEKLLTYENIVEYFITRQSDKWSISVYNEDADFKYVSMVRTDNDTKQLNKVRGTGEEHLKYFIKNRIMYCDSKWDAGEYPLDTITLRLYSPEGDLPIAPKHDITVVPYSNMYVGVRYNANGKLDHKKAYKNEPITFYAPTNSEFGETDSYIYGASEISSIGNLASLYCGEVNVSKATKLTELLIGSDVAGYSNNNLKTVTVGTNKLLQKIDVRNCSALGTGDQKALNLSNCPNIQEVYATGTSIQAVDLPIAGYLHTIHLPSTTTNLTIKNQRYIEDFYMEKCVDAEGNITGYNNLTTLWIENTSGVPVGDIIKSMTKEGRVRLIDAYWEEESEEALAATIERFKNSLGLEADGSNTDKAVVTGRVKVPSIGSDLYADIYTHFPNLIIDDGNIQYIMKYVDYDGSTLYTELLPEGDNAIDPVEEGKIEAPIRPNTEDCIYEYAGWSMLPTNVDKHYTIVAQYNAQYAIKFYNNDELLYTQWVSSGGNAKCPVADGTIEEPTREGTADLRYKFSGWSNLPTNVSSAVSVYAQYSNVYPVRFYNSDVDNTMLYEQWVVEGEDAVDPTIQSGVKPTKNGVENEVKYKYKSWDQEMPTAVDGICTVTALYDIYWAARFMNGNEIYLVEWVLDGEDAIAPEEYFEDYVDPTKESTAQYDFHFSEWDGTWTSITEPRDFAAVYTNELRKYNVYFYTDDVLLQTVEGVYYGSGTNYTGSTPIKQGVDNPEEYEFQKWVPAPQNITGDTNCYALFKFTGYIKDDWDVIAENVANGTAVDLYEIGGRKEIQIAFSDGTSVVADVEIIAKEHDDLADESGKATLTFFCKDLPNLQRQMNDTEGNAGGWEASDMREFLNGELFDALPDGLKTIIKPVYKISDGGSSNKALVTTVDKCWLASYDEVALPQNSYSLQGQDEVYSLIFSDKESRKKYLYGDVNTAGWWLRSSYYSLNNDQAFFRVTSAGNSYGDIAYVNSYVAFGFCV